MKKNKIFKNLSFEMPELGKAIANKTIIMSACACDRVDNSLRFKKHRESLKKWLGLKENLRKGKKLYYQEFLNYSHK